MSEHAAVLLPALSPGTAPSLTGSRNRWHCKLPDPWGGGFISSATSKRRNVHGKRRKSGGSTPYSSKHQLGERPRRARASKHGLGCWAAGDTGQALGTESHGFSCALAISDKTLLKKGDFELLVASSKRLYEYLFIYFTLVYSRPQWRSHRGKR